MVSLGFTVCSVVCPCQLFCTGQVGLGVGSWPSNRATEGSNPKGTDYTS